MCQTKDLPIQDWVKLAVSRAKATGAKAIFWLNPARAHDANLIGLVNKYMAAHDTTGLDIEFMTPAEACAVSCTRARQGLDTMETHIKVEDIFNYGEGLAIEGWGGYRERDTY